jgi:hypothetical protein
MSDDKREQNPAAEKVAKEPPPIIMNRLNSAPLLPSTTSEIFDAEQFDEMLGEAPVRGEFEDGSDYLEIKRRMLETIRPTNYIDELLTIDAIDATYDILNIRRVIVDWNAASTAHGIEEALIKGILSDLPPAAERMVKIEAKHEAKRWREGDGETRDEIEERLRTMGISVELEIFFQGLPRLECLEKRLFAAQQRRNAIFREVWVHRELARRARRISDEIIEHDAPPAPNGK